MVHCCLVGGAFVPNQTEKGVERQGVPLKCRFVRSTDEFQDQQSMGTRPIKCVEFSDQPSNTSESGSSSDLDKFFFPTASTSLNIYFLRVLTEISCSFVLVRVSSFLQKINSSSPVTIHSSHLNTLVDRLSSMYSKMSVQILIHLIVQFR